MRVLRCEEDVATASARVPPAVASEAIAEESAIGRLSVATIRRRLPLDAKTVYV